VRIVKQTGKPVAEVARDLGINAYTLHNWVKADREADGQDAGGTLSDSEREELAGLRARIKISTWIADFYNTRRRHSANDGLDPIPFERRMAEARRTSTAQLRAEVA
jgi:transposase-like protein